MIFVCVITGIDAFPIASFLNIAIRGRSAVEMGVKLASPVDHRRRTILRAFASDPHQIGMLRHLVK